MSTKIYNGYRVYASSLDEAINELKKPKKIISSLIIEEAFVELLKDSKVLLDNEILKHTLFSSENEKPEEDENNLGSPLGIIYNRNLDALNSNDENIEVTNVIYPESLIDEMGRTYYLFTHYALEKFSKIYFENLKNVQEYGYWNNTDAPEGMSDFQWNTRSDDWDKVLLNEGGIPAEVGLTQVVARTSKKYLHHDRKIFEQYLSKNKDLFSIEKRVKFYVETFMAKKVEVELTNKNPNIQSYQIFKAFKNKEYSQELLDLEKNTERLLKELLPEINYVVLTSKFEQLIPEYISLYNSISLSSHLDNTLNYNKKSKSHKKI